MLGLLKRFFQRLRGVRENEYYDGRDAAAHEQKRNAEWYVPPVYPRSYDEGRPPH